ncbi:MAG: ATP synthase F0 subunit B, partial [Pirellulales bacterium]|nr:ATP synthase F0 subunit B [Pirellulales bacterium]
LEAAKRDAAAVREKAVNEAQEAAQRERERAVADINVAKNQALQEVAGTVTDLSIALASQIVRREVNASDHANLVTEALQQLPSSN